jgi:hypothetical protein
LNVHLAGMLVNRWGILRRALPATIGLNRCMLLVMCLCRLHNFCITKRLRHKERMSGGVPSPLACDQMENTACGGIRVEVNQEHNVEVPNSLLHGGHHHDDTSRMDRRKFERQHRQEAINNQLPRDLLHDIVVQRGCKRPEPKQWKEIKKAIGDN